jgi:hypothetical protein
MPGNPAILQQAAATQLFMVQAPVPVEILLKEGVMKHLLELTTQLATCCTPDAQQATLQVPSSCMNPVTGRAFPTSMFMLACPFTNGNTMVSGDGEVAAMALMSMFASKLLRDALLLSYRVYCMHAMLPKDDVATMYGPSSV